MRNIMDLYDILYSWVTANLYRSNKFDSETNEVTAEKASVELGDSIDAEMVADILHDIRRNKNFNLESYPFETSKPSW